MKERIRRVIGRNDLVDLPEFLLENIEAKVDTGAYTSAIHGSQVQVIEVNGRKRIVFHIMGSHQNGLEHQVFSTENFTEKYIKSSFGQIEKRFVIKTKIRLFGKLFRTEFSLADRTDMRFPILLGRKLLRNRFIVDVTQRNLSYVQKTQKQL